MMDKAAFARDLDLARSAGVRANSTSPSSSSPPPKSTPLPLLSSSAMDKVERSLFLDKFMDVDAEADDEFCLRPAPGVLRKDEEDFFERPGAEEGDFSGLLRSRASNKAIALLRGPGVFLNLPKDGDFCFVLRSTISKDLDPGPPPLPLTPPMAMSLMQPIPLPFPSSEIVTLFSPLFFLEVGPGVLVVVVKAGR